MTTVLIDQRGLAALAEAMTRGHKVSACTTCGGPEVHSKITAQARCFRCGLVRQTAFVVPAVFRRRCKRCRRFFKTSVEYLTCEGCRGRLREPLEDAPRVMQIAKDFA